MKILNLTNTIRVNKYNKQLCFVILFLNYTKIIKYFLQCKERTKIVFSCSQKKITVHFRDPEISTRIKWDTNTG